MNSYFCFLCITSLSSFNIPKRQTDGVQRPFPQSNAGALLPRASAVAAMCKEQRLARRLSWMAAPRSRCSPGIGVRLKYEICQSRVRKKEERTVCFRDYNNSHDLWPFSLKIVEEGGGSYIYIYFKRII
uniref:Uncharacterized protein n=1 Tax=Molossus molossus TaxID=27622 RepID=A0A7J8I1K2_MOLMO|nr:hypothetical protein HJG59_010891 [Molossus molossus]